MATANTKIGWIGIGRMGYAMAERLAKAGADLTVWNRTRAKAEPLAALGAKVAADLTELAACDIVFVMVSTWDDVKEVVAGAHGLLSGRAAPKMVIECSSTSSPAGWSTTAVTSLGACPPRYQVPSVTP